MDHTKNEPELVEENLQFEEISDEGLERAADTWSTAAFTLGNCTGLGSCPA